MEQDSWVKKVRRVLKQQALRSVSASQLVIMNNDYQQKYQGMPADEVEASFMMQFQEFLELDLARDGYLFNPHSPQAYLTSNAKVGLKQMILFTGLFPRGYEAQLDPIIRKYLAKLFRLRDMDGFHLAIRPTKETALVGLTAISLAWNFTPDQVLQQQQLHAQFQQQLQAAKVTAPIQPQPQQQVPQQPAYYWPNFHLPTFGWPSWGGPPAATPAQTASTTATGGGTVPSTPILNPMGAQGMATFAPTTLPQPPPGAMFPHPVAMQPQPTGATSMLPMNPNDKSVVRKEVQKEVKKNLRRIQKEIEKGSGNRDKSRGDTRDRERTRRSTKHI